MLPAEKLRLELEQKYNINISQYAWPEDLKKFVFSIPLDKELEQNANYLEEIYNLGYNIGHCGVTSRYLVKNIKGAKLHYGYASLLIGTKSSPNGGHAWVTINNLVIDTTLMICFPVEISKLLGYELTRTISDTAAQVLSEYDIYDHDFAMDKPKTQGR